MRSYLFIESNQPYRSFLGSTKYLAYGCLLFIGFMLFSETGSSQSSYSNLFEMNEFEISHVGFNTEASDFGPSIVGDELWFSAYSSKNLKKAKKGMSKNLYYSIFKTPIDARGFTLYEPREPINDFNSGFHEGPVSYCAQTGELFVTLSNTVSVDVLEDGVVKKKEKIRLRIVSCTNHNGVWIVNEEMPFNDKLYSVGHPAISVSGDTLFFTSDLPSMSKGGTDIFMVTRNNHVWGTPVALGENINSAGEEMFPFYSPSGMLIFASNGRADCKGGLDLYCSCMLPEGASEAKPLSVFNSEYDDFGLIIHPSGESGYFVSNRPGQNGDDDIYLIKIKKTFIELMVSVLDDFTRNPIKGAEVTLYSCDGNKIDNGIVDENGQFLFKVLRGGCYVVGASAKGYPENRKAYGKEQNVVIDMKHDRSLQLVFLDYFTHNPIENVRINLDNSPAVQLSEDGFFFKKLTTEREIQVFASVGGYLNERLIIDATKEFYTEKDIMMMKLELDNSYIIEGISFDKDDWMITPSTAIALDQFIILMTENPAIKVEIDNYTDSRGDDQYNLSLSRHRSESIVDYLLKKGVPRQRLLAKGCGETQLLNRCSNGVECSNEEHSKNNRTEFKIIGFVK